MKVARYLIDEGLPVSSALIHGAHSVDLAMADELLKKGSTVNEQAIFSAVDAGKVDVALLMIEIAASNPCSLAPRDFHSRRGQASLLRGTRELNSFCVS